MNKSFFLTKNAKNARSATAKDEPNFIFPPVAGYCDEGIASADPRCLDLNSRLATRLTDTIGANVDDEGISDQKAVPSNFYSLFTVSGFATDMFIPMLDNHALRNELKLYNNFEGDRDRQIFDELMALCYGNWIQSPVHISRDSSTCFPYFVKGVDAKKELFRYTCRLWDDISKFVMKGDLQGLYDKHNAVIMYYMGTRLQPDKVILESDGSRKSKDRYLWDLEYAMSGGLKGNRWVADKSISTPDFSIKGHFRMRKRVVFGTAGWMNYFLNSIFNGFREHYLHEYEFTWKHRTSDQILGKIQQFKHFVGFDVHQYDNTFADFMFDRWLLNLRNYVREDVVKLIELALHSPFYQPNMKVGQNEKLMIGNPLNPDHFGFNYGLPSGIPPNPDLGKLMMTFNLLVRMDREFHDVLEVGIDTILKGKHPLYGILNMGDDSIILMNDDQVYAKIQADIEKDRDPSPYFKMEKEKAISFLGNVFYRDAEGDIQLAPNLVSMFSNWFVPEMSTTHRRRKYWAIGWEERNAYYMQAPSFSTAWDILSEEFYNTYGLNPDLYARRGKEIAGDPQFCLATDLERLLLDDPSKMHYRISPKDISPELLNQITTVLPEDDVIKYIQPLINARIL